MYGPVRTTRRRAGDDRGFTLIEMLVVVVIIGVLAGIAIPVYLNYRKGAENKSAEADVRGGISAVEQYYTDNGSVYPATRNSLAGQTLTFPAQAGGTAQSVSVSAGNTIYYRNNATFYVICGQNSSGQTIYVYNSSTGNPVKKSQQASLANCAANGN